MLGQLRADDLLLENPQAIAQIWLFIAAPLIGAGVAGLLFKSGTLAADED